MTYPLALMCQQECESRKSTRRVQDVNDQVVYLTSSTGQGQRIET